MNCCTDPDTLARLAQARADLAEVQAAISAVRSGNQSYTLSTGQTTQTVTLASLRWLIQDRNDLQQEVDTLLMRCSGAGVTRMAPGW